MTNEEFKHYQDQHLKLSGKELAQKLHVSAASVSRWCNDQPIPGHIADLVCRMVAEKAAKIQLPMSLDELFALSRAAAARGTTFEALITAALKNLIAEELPDNIVPLPDQTRVAEDSDPPDGPSGLSDGD